MPEQAEEKGYERSVLDGAHEAFVSMDAGGFVVDWNPEAERTFGWSRDEAIGMVLADAILPERYHEAHRHALRRFMETGDAPILGRRFQMEARHRAGQEFPIEVTISASELDGVPRFHAFLRDISDRRLAERLLAVQQAVTTAFALAESGEEAVAELLAAIGDRMGWALGSYWDTDGELLSARRVWRAEATAATEEFEAETLALTLRRGEGLPGRVAAAGEPVWIDDVMVERNFPRTVVAVQAGFHAAVGVPVLRGSECIGVIEFFHSEQRAPECPVIEMLASMGAQVGRFMEVLKERSELLVRLEELALTDALTELPNRRAWEQWLPQALARAARSGEEILVALLDLDSFKLFNDRHGHHEGDDLLVECARAWSAQLRSSDLLARYGGEEFALAFPAWPPETAHVVLERVRAATPRGQACSAGLALWDRSESGEELVRRADAALYEAKRAGGDRTVMAGAPGA